MYTYFEGLTGVYTEKLAFLNFIDDQEHCSSNQQSGFVGETLK